MSKRGKWEVRKQNRGKQDAFIRHPADHLASE